MISLSIFTEMDDASIYAGPIREEVKVIRPAREDHMCEFRACYVSAHWVGGVGGKWVPSIEDACKQTQKNLRRFVRKYPQYSRG